MARLTSFVATIEKWPISDKIALANCIFTGFFLLATIISVICAFKAYKHQKERARKEAACSLARYYSENIISRYAFVSSVLQRAKLDDTAKKLFPYQELLQFNKDELLSFLERHDISYDTVENNFILLDPQSILTAKLSFVASIHEKNSLIQEYIILDKETGEKRVGYADSLRLEFHDKVSGYLNDLEWFSMSCRYGISDEEILYQSLHQTFLSTVWQLYFYICIQNLTSEDKLYTNIIWLFNKWRARLTDLQRAATKEQIKAQKKIDAAERKLKNATPKVYSGKPLKK